MQIDPQGLQGHADANQSLRLAKARKIEALLGGRDAIAGLRLLDLGAGSGLLSEYFAGAGALVTAADRDPSEFKVAGITCEPIERTRLPFADASFDLVVFNHVIEHVGPAADQAEILAEIARCLRVGGQMYLAVPNRWALIEPHYRLPLLGALPRKLADALVRRSGLHEFYDCYPLRRQELLNMVGTQFANVRDASIDAFRLAVEHEFTGPLRRALSLLPQMGVRALRPIFPTFIVIARKSA